MTYLSFNFSLCWLLLLISGQFFLLLFPVVSIEISHQFWGKLFFRGIGRLKFY